jgi:hypothetical protein
MTVHVSTADPRESANIPRDVLEAALERSQARSVRNFVQADTLHNNIIKAGYRLNV